MIEHSSLRKQRKFWYSQTQGVKLIFFSDSHLAPKFIKMVANSKKVGRHFERQTKPFFYAVIVLEIK